MSEIWPFDVKRRMDTAAPDNIRPFKCLLLMPFEGRFDQVAEIIRTTVLRSFESFPKFFNFDQATINRLDWVTSAGVIQQEIWQEIERADLVFCDITGYNPNVMFESGVCAAWKDMRQVVFIKDHFFKQQSAFDIAPIRYTEYELTSNGITAFQAKITTLTRDALIAFPDRQGASPSVVLPLEINFQDNQDDSRIHTPPFAHRRVVDNSIEFGSTAFFDHSWASIGKSAFLNFSLEFSACFSNPKSVDAFIGVGLRSQHYYANFAHVLYLKHDGSIFITEPDEEPPRFYKDTQLREPTPIDPQSCHYFHVVFNKSVFRIEVDNFSHTFRVDQMAKVFGAGLIRFQSALSWMRIIQVRVSEE
jgi:hypothetical protein